MDIILTKGKSNGGKNTHILVSTSASRSTLASASSAASTSASPSAPAPTRVKSEDGCRSGSCSYQLTVTSPACVRRRETGMHGFGFCVAR